jgi:hypothetical protein
MGPALGRIWSAGNPELHDCCSSLKGWSREALAEACGDFKSLPTLAVNLHDFWKILKFDDREKAEAAFSKLQNTKQRVEWLPVVAAMIVMSDQKYISRVTCLFSICDFNGTGRLNKAELCIGLRLLLLGLSRCFSNVGAPGNRDGDSESIRLFDTIDEDNTGYISIENILSFAYRSKELRLLLSPFPASDRRIFEQPLLISSANRAMRDPSLECLRQQEQHMRGKLQLTPDAPRARRSVRQSMRQERRQWKPRRTHIITKQFSWCLYKIFMKLRTQSNEILVQELEDLVGDPYKFKQFVWETCTGNVEDASEPSLSNYEKTEADSVRVHSSRLETLLRRPEFSNRLQSHQREHGEDSITLRALFCLCFPNVPEA